MSKFKVGDEVAIAAVVKITGIQPQRDGTVSYSNDRGLTINETLMNEIALFSKTDDRLVGLEEPKPKPAENPYAKYFTHSVEAEKRSELKIGDRVYHKSNGMGTVVGFEYDGTSWVWCMYDSKNSRPYPALSCYLRKIATTTPAQKFKVGDRVVTKFGNGTVVEINYQYEITAYTVEHDNASPELHSGRWDIVNGKGFPSNRCYFFSEHDLSPAPEPKYYTGKVVMIACQYPDREPFIGRLFEFKNGKYVGEKGDGVAFFGEPYKSFKDIVEIHHTSSWIEVKE